MGEVFLLLSLLSEEWGWGRSQKTGMSGLVPIAIMEDVVRSLLVCLEGQKMSDICSELILFFSSDQRGH